MPIGERLRRCRSLRLGYLTAIYIGIRPSEFKDGQIPGLGEVFSGPDRIPMVAIGGPPIETPPPPLLEGSDDDGSTEGV